MVEIRAATSTHQLPPARERPLKPSTERLSSCRAACDPRSHHRAFGPRAIRPSASARRPVRQPVEARPTATAFGQPQRPAGHLPTVQPHRHRHTRAPASGVQRVGLSSGPAYSLRQRPSVERPGPPAAMPAPTPANCQYECPRPLGASRYTITENAYNCCYSQQPPSLKQYYDK
jgi:hypothetical protein